MKVTNVDSNNDNDNTIRSNKNNNNNDNNDNNNNNDNENNNNYKNYKIKKRPITIVIRKKSCPAPVFLFCALAIVNALIYFELFWSFFFCKEIK